MYSTNNNYWRCDPEKHIKNKTYLEITQLLQVIKNIESMLTYNTYTYRYCDSASM